MFNHFPTKEALFFDRSGEAAELLRAAVHDRAPGTDVLNALQALAVGLFEERAPLSGVDPRSDQFFRTVAESPTLVARVRVIGADLQRILAEELERDEAFTGDSVLLAAFFIAGMATVMVASARRLLGGADPDSILDDHAERLDRLFTALRGAFPA